MDELELCDTCFECGFLDEVLMYSNSITRRGPEVLIEVRLISAG